SRYCRCPSIPFVEAMTKPFTQRCRRAPRKARSIGRAAALAIVATAMIWPARANAAMAGSGLPSDDQPAGFRLPTEDQAPAGPARPSPEPITGTKGQLDRDPRSLFLFCPVDQPRHYMDDFGQPR